MAANEQANAAAPAQSRFREQLDVFCERGILVLVALVMVWGPLAFGGSPAPAFLVMAGLVMLALALWAVRIWVQRPMRLYWPPVCWGVFIFLLYAMVRCRVVLLTYIAGRELLYVTVYASLFFIVINNLNHRNSATVITFCLIGLGLVLSWLAVYQFATRSASVWGVPRMGQYVGRGGGTYINPNHLAGFLGMVIPLALSYTFVSRFKPTIKVLLCYCALAMLAGIGVSLSRGGMVAVGITLVAFCFLLGFQRGYGFIGLGILTALVAGGIVFSTESGALQKRYEAAFKKGEPADTRLAYWPAAIHIFEDHPLWGGGPGHFDSEFARYRPPVVQSRPVYTHNDYLNTLSDWGAVGLLIVLTTCGLVYYSAFKTWPVLLQADHPDAVESRKSDKLAFLLGATLGLLALLLHSMVDFNMHVPANAAIAVTLMALICAQSRFATDHYWKNPRLFGKIALTVVLAAAVAWLGAASWPRTREAWWRWRAKNEKIPDAERVAAWKNAYDAEPGNFENSYYLGEYYRLASQEGNPGYENQARDAMTWYAKSMAANPLDALPPLRYGMCLDWIGQTNEATPYFYKAEKLDPNNVYVATCVGRHYMELHDYAAAKKWFEHSKAIKWSTYADWSLESLKERMASELYK